MNWKTPLAVWLVVAGSCVFLAAFAAVFALIWRVVGSVGDWRKLAERYPAAAQPDGPSHRWQTIVVGGHLRYRNITTVTISDRGLYLSVRMPGHTPVLIPWHEVKRVSWTRVYWRRAAQLTIGDPPLTTVTLPMRIFEAARPYLGGVEGSG